MTLIDLDEVINAIYSINWYHLFNGELSEGAEGDESALYKATDIYKAVGEVPVVDAIPVRHGTWRHYERMLTCSECGTVFYDDIMEYFGEEVPRYCPECGARMDL